VLFDGECNLCDGAVQFLLRRDPRGRLRFAALQSPAAARLLAGARAPTPLPDSLVLIADGAVHVRSGAALRIAARLRWPWPLLFVFWLVPRPLRDLAYDFVARRRTRWFGRRSSCRVPTPEERGRFLEDGSGPV
jgi:predicted DCC family thiol-disulfide oxidoreductase YuxK